MTSVVFTSKASPPNDERDGSSVHISVALHQQNLLVPPPPTHGGAVPASYSVPPRTSVGCPLLFERATKSWWDPKFDSNILEDQYRRSTFPLTCQRFQYALLFVFLASVCYCIYFACMARSNWIVFVAATFMLICCMLVILLFTYTPHYQAYCLPTSLATTFVLCALSLAAFYSFTTDDASPLRPDISPVGLFSMCIVVLLLTYTVIPLPLYICILVGGTYSVAFETLSALLTRKNEASMIVVKVLLQLCIHLIGVHVLLMSEVRMRNTFMKVGQSLMVRRDLELERQLKEKMIHSIMPPKVADWLMTTQESEEETKAGPLDDGERRISASPRQSQMIFRPFNMHRMEDVSILFADIVGFTKMSSNKTAEQLVGLLNDLFGRFDYLCNKLGCEKISTLGDCYYCVSGCPEPRSDHARCCVEMGLGMIKAIGEFDEDTNEDVNMRVGVHTGTVLCGIVGTCRFKFDVWSNDVKFANLMESTGKPGRVHISEATYSFLMDQYNVEEGHMQNGVRTFFIKGRKPTPYNRILSSSTGSSNRHSWPLHISHPTSEVPSRADSRKPSSQSERERDPEDGVTVPMLPVPRHSSLVTLSSSRKDSGIRSRHSSLQDVMFDTPASLFVHRISGYYASSQLSMADTGRSSGSSVRGCNMFVDPALSLNESLARLRHIRKQSDLQLIRCVQQDSEHVDYFVRPPINQISLFFLDSLMECDYRRHLHSRGAKESVFTLASPAFNSYFDVVVCTVFFAAVAVSCFLLFPATPLWLTFCFFATAFQTFVVIIWLHELLACAKPIANRNWLSKTYATLTKWYPWHICGAVLVAMPVVCVFANFSCTNVMNDPRTQNAFCYLVLSTIVHFCNFTELNLWVKCILANLAGTILVALLGASACPCYNMQISSSEVLDLNDTLRQLMPGRFDSCSEFPQAVYEIVLDVLLISILVWFLNREFEISYRLSFHGSITAARDKRRIQTMKNQADWLLHNIIPKHVAEQLKSTSKYSENHKDAGIIFASIVNFHELYDESFEGGKECLRVLNELVGDFDELLRKPEFKNVEKIKTIGSTFMAASGLNPQLRQDNPHPYSHLYELMDFALSMLQVIDRFNYNLLEFSFVMRIGYNFGDVTAGVIGTTKLYYDIWGDAVNIASRMDSHGVPGHIQVPEHCLSILSERFDFKYRGSIYVKGKNNMNVHLLIGKKSAEEASKVQELEVDEPQQKSPQANGR